MRIHGSVPGNGARHRAPLRSSALALALLAGCNGAGDRDFPFDRGCITVDGEGGYLHLSDALSQADEGAEIQLCNGFVPESVTVDRSVTIMGNGAGRTVVTAPDNEPAIRVLDGVTLTLSDLTVRSTRNGIEACPVSEGLDDCSTSLVLDRVTFDRIDNHAIEARGSDVIANEIDIEGAGWGGILLSGGSLSLTDSEIENVAGFGVRLENASTAEIRGTLFYGTRFTQVTQDGTDVDGFGVDLNGNSTATLVDNVFDLNTVGGVKVASSSLSLTGGEMTRNYAGLWVDQALSLDVSDVPITESFMYGVALLSSHDATFEGVDIALDPETSAQHEEGEETRAGSYGIIAIDADFTFRNGSIAGANEAGILNRAQLTTGVNVVLEDVTFADNARVGLGVLLGSLDATDVTVATTRNDPTCETDLGSFSCNFGLLLQDADATWTGGGVVDNEGLGAVVFGGALQLEAAEVSRNGRYGVYAQGAAFTARSSTFEAPGLVGVWLLDSYGTLIDSAFSDNRQVDVYAFDGGEYRYHHSGTDIGVRASADTATLTVQGTTFTDGDIGIDASGATVALTDVSFTGYNQRTVDLFSGTGALERVTLSDVGGYAVDCTNAAVTLDKVQVSGITEIATRTELVQDGEVTSDTRASTRAPAIRGKGCTYTLEDVAVTDAAERAVVTEDGVVEIDGLEVRQVGAHSEPGAGAIELAATADVAANVQINDLVVEDTQVVDALRIHRAEGALPHDDDAVSLGRLRLGRADAPLAGAGLVLERVGGVDVQGLMVTGAAGAGVVATDAAGAIDGTAGGATGVIQAGADGIVATRSALDLRNLTVPGAGGSGLALVGGTYALDAVSATDAGAWGMVCDVDDAPVFDACDGVDVSGASGAHDGCGACLD